MKTIKKPLFVIFVSLIVLSTLCMSVFAANGFTYQHDPSLNPYAMQDIVADETAIYGFKPNDTGSLKLYADADWSDPAVVEQGRQDRIVYHQSIEAMYDILEEMAAQGKSVEEIARAVSTKRNEIRLAAYNNDPEGLTKLKARNLEKYGHEEGPLPDELYEQYGSWGTVMEKAFSANAGMDACLGLYDDYYSVYVALGQVEEPQKTAADTATDGITENNETTLHNETVRSPATGDGISVIYVVIVIASSALALGAVSIIPHRSTKELMSH